MSDKKTDPKEEAIKAKMAAGLSRTQATEVVDNQAAHDAQLAEAEEAAAKKSKKDK